MKISTPRTRWSVGNQVIYTPSHWCGPSSSSLPSQLLTLPVRRGTARVDLTERIAAALINGYTYGLIFLSNEAFPLILCAVGLNERPAILILL